MRTATVRIWALHLVGNAAIVAGVYLWLNIGDSTALRLVATALFGLLLVASTVWLHGLVFAHFREPDLPLLKVFQTALRRLPPLIVVAIVAAALYWLLEWLLGRAYDPAAGTASWFTLHLRSPVRPALILSIVTWAVRIVEWVIVPVLLLPLAAVSLARLRAWTFWIACPLLLLLAVYVPWRLMHWVPYHGGLGLELTSFIARWLVAWLLFVTAWFTLVALTCGRRLWGHGGAA